MNNMVVESCSVCKNYICRCSDCFALVERNELWFCDEYQDYCSRIDECLEYLPTESEVCDE